LAPILEALGAYLESPEPEIALSIQRSLFIVLAEMGAGVRGGVFDYRGRRLVCALIAEAAEARRSSTRAIDWVADTANRIERTLVLAEVLSPESAAVLKASAWQMASDIRSRQGTGNDLTVEDLGVFARPRQCVQLLTVHKAKGREFEAVAVVDAHDGRFPHFSTYNIGNGEERKAAIDESRRVLYVAATRAKRILMFFSDRSHRRNQPSPFLREMGL